MTERKQIALLGGGQLGRMFIENALRYDVQIRVMDPSADAPCAGIAHAFVQGDLNDKEQVLAFCTGADVVGIEIEHVSVEALAELESNGIQVIPSPNALRIIKDKGAQKEFYRSKGIPTAPFKLLAEKKDLIAVPITGTAFLKARTGGYDGRGVMSYDRSTPPEDLFPGPYLLEEKAEIDKELAVIVVRDQRGNMVHYPIIEMVFDPTLNLVDHLIAPAGVDADTEQKCIELARKVVHHLGSPGVFAVELFLNRSGEVWVNETAPRVHNSGHITIEACVSSQFDQMLRVLQGWPLGDASLSCVAGMFNLIGENGDGAPYLEGLEEVLAEHGAFVHIYGKKQTRSGRKMGHVTIVGMDRTQVEQKLLRIKRSLKVIPNTSSVRPADRT